MKCLSSLIGVLLLAVSSTASSTQTIRWDRVPLPVQLHVGQERILFMDGTARIGVPEQIKERLQIQSVGGALYLTARSEFASTRVQVQDVDSGALILLDISAVAPDPGIHAQEPIRIVTPTITDEAITEESPATTATRSTPIPVLLTRYAAQHLYAPMRAVEPLSGVSMAPNAPIPSKLLAALTVQARPRGAWRLGNYWVTAIEITNASSAAIELDPRLLNGRLIAVTFQHHDLGPKDTPTDTTAAYVVTRGGDITSAVDGLTPSSEDLSGAPRREK